MNDIEGGVWESLRVNPTSVGGRNHVCDAGIDVGLRLIGRIPYQVSLGFRLHVLSVGSISHM